jgi:dTMP kinase
VRGRFITLEGIDGAGKSTHLAALATRFQKRGSEVVCTREPGGTPLAEQLRGLFLNEPMDAMTEALLVFAARRDHLREVILPAIDKGRTVLCDRFTDATFAYQGFGRGFSTDILNQLEHWVQGDCQPDLTLWFDLSPHTASMRRSMARDADRFEQQDLDFFARVRRGYQTRAEAAPRRFARIDAERDLPDVARQIDRILEARQW